MDRLEQESSVRNRTGEEIANGALEPPWDSMPSLLLLSLREAGDRLTNFLEAEGVMTINFSAIPEELRSRPQWVLWRWLERPDKTTGELKWTKPPYQPNGISAKSNNPSTWVSFVEAKAAYESGGFSGIGYVVTADAETTSRRPAMVDDGITGVDLDHVVDPETGRIEPWAQSIVDKVNSYAEISPSGTGLRIFVFAKLPPKDRKVGNFECYELGRYMTVTGNHLPGTPATIEKRQNEMTAVHTEAFRERNKKPPKQGPPPQATPVDLDDDALLDVAFRSKNGEAVRHLYHGDTAQYASPSEADLALCSYLAFYASGDTVRVDRIFRASKLWRPKWDDQRGSATYGELTIAKALEGITEFYTGHSNGLQPNVVNSVYSVDSVQGVGESTTLRIGGSSEVPN